MKLEVWKDIIDYPNYQVSNFGNVKSKERYTKQRNGFSLRKEGLYGNIKCWDVCKN